MSFDLFSINHVHMIDKFNSHTCASTYIDILSLHSLILHLFKCSNTQLDLFFVPIDQFFLHRCAIASTYTVCNSSSLTGNDVQMYGNWSTVSGLTILEGVVTLPLYADFLVIMAFLVVFRVLAYLTLRFKWKS